MRLSTEEGDIGYSKEATHYVAFLNGIKQDLCLTADTEKGFCIVAKRDFDGKIMAENGKLRHKIVFGEVRLERR